MQAWIKYSLIRVVLFAVIFGVLLALQVNWFLAAIIAAVAGLAISYIFFRKLRDRVALDLAARRQQAHPASPDDAEDDALDA